MQLWKEQTMLLKFYFLCIDYIATHHTVLNKLFENSPAQKLLCIIVLSLKYSKNRCIIWMIYFLSLSLDCPLTVLWKNCKISCNPETTKKGFHWLGRWRTVFWWKEAIGNDRYAAIEYCFDTSRNATKWKVLKR